MHHSWPVSPKTDNITKHETSDNEPDSHFFDGSLHVLKLFEFSRVVGSDKDFIGRCLRSCGKLWIDTLIETRGKKSKLWYQDTTSSYVVWEGRRDKELEWLKDELKLPEYRLGDHVDLWKALKSLEEMIEDVKNEEVTLDPVLDRLEESGLQHDFLRTTILQRFLCENADTRLNDLSLHETTTHQDNPPNLPASVNGSFAITVSRSRMNDRLLFYAKDTMLYDGLKWGFFKKGPKIETLDAQNKKVEADVQLSWKNTVQIQGIDQEAIWETPLRYALALCMAELGQSLDATKAPTEIADISWKNILRGIWPSGLFAPKVDRNTKRPDF